MPSQLILAHGVGKPFESPLPLSLYLGAAALTVIVSFAIRALVPDRDHAVTERRLLGPRGVTILIRVLQVIALVFLALALLSGAVIRELGLTFAPLAFWVGLIVGGTTLSVILGGIWVHVDPWAAIERTYRIKDVEPEPRSLP
ncbi:MAG: hypothetical protein QOH90_523, partial [Actinomycetota bacterium]|nr:hypothetical protein [Actinomycetota bacterium]